MKIQWREDIVNPVLCFNANCSAIRKLRQTLKQHQHLWFANPPKQTNRPSTMRIFHEFPWISTAKTHHFIRPHLFGGMDFFFRPQHNIPCSSCQAIFLRCLSEWLPEGEGRERMDSYPGQNLPRYLGLFIFCTFQVGVAQLKLFLIYSVFEGNDWW